MRSEVATGLSGAFWDEKKEIFSYPFKNSKSSLAMLAIGLPTLTEGIRLIYEHNILTGTELSQQDELKFFAVLSTSVLIICVGLLQINHRFNNSRDRGIVGTWSQDVPNPQIPSIVLGSTSLLLNSGKLIKVKKG